LELPVSALTDLRQPERILLLRYLELSKLLGDHTPEVNNLASNLETDISLSHGKRAVTKRD
jgi:hypothetical protein